VAKCRVVGSADPHPNMCTSIFSICSHKVIKTFRIGGIVLREISRRE
jgi:hypothetical protein